MQPSRERNKRLKLICIAALMNFCAVLTPLVANTDSLRQLLQQKNLADTSRIFLLTEIGQNEPVFRTGYWDTVIAQCESAGSRSKEIAVRNFASYYLAAALNNKGYIVKNNGDPEAAIKLYERSLEVIRALLKQKENSRWKKMAEMDMAQTMNNIAVILVDGGKVKEGTELYNECYAIRLATGDEEGAALTLNNLAYIYGSTGDIEQALQTYHKSLALAEKHQDAERMAYVFGNIAALYADFENIDYSLRNHRKALQLWKKAKIPTGEVTSLNNIGVCYLELRQTDSAEYCFIKAMHLSGQLNYSPGIATSTYNLGNFYSVQKDFKNAERYFLQSLEIKKKMGNTRSIAECMQKLGETYYATGNIGKAEKYCSSSLETSRQLGFPALIKSAAECLFKIYSHTGKDKEAYETFSLFVRMKDSLSNEKTRKATIKTELKYEYEKKAAADSIRHNEEQKVKDALILVKAAELKQERTQFWFVITGLLFVAGGLLLVWNRFRLISRQKNIIETQKVQVDAAYEKLHEKNKEVMDSIHYARRIQRALITNERYIEKALGRLRTPKS